MFGIEPVQSPSQNSIGVAVVRLDDGAAGGHPGHFRRLPAHTALRAVVDASERIGEAVESLAVPLGKSGEKGHGICTKLCSEIQKLSRDFAISFLPGDGLELTGTTGTYPA